MSGLEFGMLESEMWTWACWAWAFVLGLFDVDDNRTLDETEFAAFVTAFIYGLGAAFGLRHKDDIMPSMKSIQPLGSGLRFIVIYISSAYSSAPSFVSSQHNQCIVHALPHATSRSVRLIAIWHNLATLDFSSTACLRILTMKIQRLPNCFVKARTVVQRLYNRLGEIAASRLKELCRASTLDRTALAEAIRIQAAGTGRRKDRSDCARLRDCTGIVWHHSIDIRFSFFYSTQSACLIELNHRGSASSWPLDLCPTSEGSGRLDLPALEVTQSRSHGRWFRLKHWSAGVSDAWLEGCRNAWLEGFHCWPHSH